MRRQSMRNSGNQLSFNRNGSVLNSDNTDVDFNTRDPNWYDILEQTKRRSSSIIPNQSEQSLEYNSIRMEQRESVYIASRNETVEGLTIESFESLPNSPSINFMNGGNRLFGKKANKPQSVTIERMISIKAKSVDNSNLNSPSFVSSSSMQDITGMTEPQFKRPSIRGKSPKRFFKKPRVTQNGMFANARESASPAFLRSGNNSSDDSFIEEVTKPKALFKKRKSPVKVLYTDTLEVATRTEPVINLNDSIKQQVIERKLSDHHLEMSQNDDIENETLEAKKSLFGKRKNDKRHKNMFLDAISYDKSKKFLHSLDDDEARGIEQEEKVDQVLGKSNQRFSVDGEIVSKAIKNISAEKNFFLDAKSYDKSKKSSYADISFDENMEQEIQQISDKLNSIQNKELSTNKVSNEQEEIISKPILINDVENVTLEAKKSLFGNRKNNKNIKNLFLDAISYDKSKKSLHSDMSLDENKELDIEQEIKDTEAPDNLKNIINKEVSKRRVSFDHEIISKAVERLSDDGGSVRSELANFSPSSFASETFNFEKFRHLPSSTMIGGDLSPRTPVMKKNSKSALKKLSRIEDDDDDFEILQEQVEDVEIPQEQNHIDDKISNEIKNASARTSNNENLISEKILESAREISRIDDENPLKSKSQIISKVVNTMENLGDEIECETDNMKQNLNASLETIRRQASIKLDDHDSFKIMSRKVQTKSPTLANINMLEISSTEKCNEENASETELKPLSQSAIDRAYIEEMEAKRTNPPVRRSIIAGQLFHENSIEIDEHNDNDDSIPKKLPIRHSNIPILSHMNIKTANIVDHTSAESNEIIQISNKSIKSLDISALQSNLHKNLTHENKSSNDLNNDSIKSDAVIKKSLVFEAMNTSRDISLKNKSNVKVNFGETDLQVDFSNNSKKNSDVEILESNLPKEIMQNMNDSDSNQKSLGFEAMNTSRKISLKNKSNNSVESNLNVQLSNSNKKDSDVEIFESNLLKEITQKNKSSDAMIQNLADDSKKSLVFGSSNSSETKTQENESNDEEGLKHINEENDDSMESNIDIDEIDTNLDETDTDFLEVDAGTEKSRKSITPSNIDPIVLNTSNKSKVAFARSIDEVTDVSANLTRKTAQDMEFTIFGKSEIQKDTTETVLRKLANISDDSTEESIALFLETEELSKNIVTDNTDAFSIDSLERSRIQKNSIINKINADLKTPPVLPHKNQENLTFKNLFRESGKLSSVFSSEGPQRTPFFNRDENIIPSVKESLRSKFKAMNGDVIISSSQPRMVEMEDESNDEMIAIPTVNQSPVSIPIPVENSQRREELRKIIQENIIKQKQLADENFKKFMDKELVPIYDNPLSMLTNVKKNYKNLKSKPSKRKIADSVKNKSMITIKKPKLYMKERWITNRLYDFIQKKLVNEYGLSTRAKSEDFVKNLADTVKTVLKSKHDYYERVLELKQKMAQLKLVTTHFEYHQFIRDYLPAHFRLKAIPACGRDVPDLEGNLFDSILVDEC